MVLQLFMIMQDIWRLETYDHILHYFFRPKIKEGCIRVHFVKSCHRCQIPSKPNQVIKPAPLHFIPVISEPSVYCVGPLSPSKSGAKYLVTVMCQATRYLPAYPL